MSKKKQRTTVRLEDRSISNRRMLNVLVDLLGERGVLTRQEVLERATRLREDEREGLNQVSAPSCHRGQIQTITIAGPAGGVLPYP